MQPRRSSPKTALLVTDLAVKVALVALALYPLLDPGASHFSGKAMGIRAVLYPLAAIVIPVLWVARGRPRPYPFVPDIALALPFVLDAAGNVFDLFSMRYFDAAPHVLGWLFFCLAVGLAVAPKLDRRWIAFGLVVGFGAVAAICWEVGEFLVMRSGASGLQLTYGNTIQDLTMGLIGSIVAGLLVISVGWPRPGTPDTLFGWQR